MPRREDDFSEETKRVLADRVGHLCSNPDCRALTKGPQLNPGKAVSVGVAGHITAAAPNGPRYNPSLSAEQRRHANNGIWLCQTCGRHIDVDPDRYPVSLLEGWKRRAELETLCRLGKTALTGSGAANLTLEEAEILSLAALSDGDAFMMRTDQTGEWVRAGSKDLYDDNEPGYAATYVEALDSLRWKGLMKRHYGGSLYELTGAGWKIARLLTPLMPSE